MSKLILVGDLHLRGSSPRSRIDNFPDTQNKKFGQVLDKTFHQDDVVTLQAGDFCDSSSVGNVVLNTYIDDLYRCVDHDCGSRIYTVFGQHDMYMWNIKHIDKTSLGVLIGAGLVQWLYKGPVHPLLDCSIELYGASWGQEVPKPENSDCFNVLVVHGAIGDVPLFKGHDIVHPKKFVRTHPGYNLILCGDYHYPFEYKIGDTLIVNPGVLCRMSIAEKDVVPSVIEYDLSTNKYKWITLDYTKDVFIENPNVVKTSEFPQSQIENFVQQLEDKDALSISFANNVRIALESMDVSELAKEEIIDILNRCENE